MLLLTLMRAIERMQFGGVFEFSITARVRRVGSSGAWGVLQSLSTSLQRVQLVLHSLYSNRCAPSLRALKLKCTVKLRYQCKAACAQTRRKTGAALTFIAGAALQFQRRLLHYCLQ